MNEDLKNQVVKILEDEQNQLDGALDNQSDVIAPSTIPKITVTQNSDGTWSKNTEEVESNMVDGSIDRTNRNVIKSKADTLQEFCKIVDNKILTINNQIDTIKQQIVVLSTKATNGNCWPGIAVSTTNSLITKSFLTNSTVKGETENIKIYPNMAGPEVNYGAVNVFEPDTIYRLTSSYAGYGYKNLPENVLVKNKDGTATGLNTDGSGSTLGNGRFDISTTPSSHQSSTFSSVGVGTTAVWVLNYPGAGVSPLASDTSVTASDCVSIANSITSLYNQIISLRNEKDSLRADLNTIKDNKKEKELASWGMNRVEHQIGERKTKNVSAIASVKSFNSDTTVNTNALVLHLDAGDSSSYSGVGTSWNDLSGNGNTTNIAPEGLTAATLEYSNGKFFTFNGTNQYAEVVNKIGLTSTTSWTMEAWFRVNGAPSNVQYSNVIVDTNPTGGTGNMITVDYGGTGGVNGYQNQLMYSSRPSGGSYTNLYGPILQQGYWYHAVVVRNGTTNTKLYTNGSLSATYSGNLPTGSQTFTRIGRWTDGTVYSNVSVSVVKIYQKAFTDDEIKTKFEASKSRYTITSISTQEHIPSSASEILSRNPSASSGIYLIRPNGYTGDPFPVYCDMTTSGGGWMHVGTIVDNNESRGEVYSTAQQSGGTHVWGAPFMPAQNTGIWQDSTILGSQSFTSNFKSQAWVSCPFTQFLIKDQGSSLRNLLYTNFGQIDDTSFSNFWGSLSWGADGSDVSNAAYAAGRVRGVSITNFGVNDPVLESSTKTVLLLKYGERDGVQDGNKDRTMIAAHSSTSAVNVDGPSGLGCFTYHDGSQGGPVQRYRNIVPTSSGYPDEPPNTISGSPYQYTIWVR